ncbi:MAG: ABC transporter permease [Caldilineales bacterium]|nr:ABC transporter permease [Caldilineales bacterium]
MPVLFRNGLRYLARRPWSTALMILGVALGVAVAVAVDIANVGARRAFDLSTEALVGRATHQIVSANGGLDEALYTRLRVEGGVRNIAPVLSEYVTSPQLGGRPLQLLGLDPFADSPFRSIFGQGEISLDSLTPFLTEPGALLLSQDLASNYGLASGSILTLTVEGRERQAFVAGLLQAEDGYSRQTLQGLLVVDVATAQELTGRLGQLDRIDLILSDDPETLARIESLLPTGVRVVEASARAGAVAEMTRAFQVNLTAMSLLALVVGMFLIYNTITFSVVQRRALFGTLRCLGVTEREVFALVLAEALVVGVVGSSLGVGLGIVLGRGAVALVSQTINDLYFVVTVSDFGLPVASLLKGLFLGVAATMAAALPPAREAAHVEPRSALRRSAIEDSFVRVAPILALAGLILLGLGAATLFVKTDQLAVAFGGITAIVIGLAMLTPQFTRSAMRALPRVLATRLGPLGRMAPRNVSQSLSRTSIAIAALMIAVSVTIGVTLMIDSFRGTVETWLTQSLQGDIYVSAPGLTGADNTGVLDPAVVAQAEDWAGVEQVRRLRRTTVDSPLGGINLAAVDDPDYGESLYAAADGSPEEVWAAVRAGAVIVSEPLVNRLGLPYRGGEITLETPDGPQVFSIAGVYYDYASSAGVVMIALENYRQIWRDDALTALSLHVQPGVDPDIAAKDLGDALAPTQSVFVRANRTLRNEALDVFDRTFAITSALRLLATLVAFVGVLSALLALQLERERELGVLRALGLTFGQLARLVFLETGLMGLVAGLLAWPTGLILAFILVYVINVRAFGWTLQMQLSLEPFLSALLIALSAALLAGIYPAWHIGRMTVAAALRSD